MSVAVGGMAVAIGFNVGVAGLVAVGIFATATGVLGIAVGALPTGLSTFFT